MADSHGYEELVDYLRSEGHSENEIERILVRVRQYENETQQDSIMDSIGNGTLDIAAMIQEALSERG